ncbi:hypothetical protein SAY87_003328 [Trapa incisa]|uniref:Uncharacterized protein n=1 Tax=Trapa incisa TaxID=236973 RepID=A0AAN7KSC7_9MYRT|nr:hypothetical protein SAY87_003328 [Trapa incisa]
MYLLTNCVSVSPSSFRSSTQKSPAFLAWWAWAELGCQCLQLALPLLAGTISPGFAVMAGTPAGVESPVYVTGVAHDPPAASKGRKFFQNHYRNNTKEKCDMTSVINKLSCYCVHETSGYLKTLRIPLPGRHPPSTVLTNGSADTRKKSRMKLPPWNGSFSALDSFESLRLKSPKNKSSPAMSSLHKQYGLKLPISNNPCEDSLWRRQKT